MNNKLVIIENGQIKEYFLDEKLTWEVGRPSKDNNPDIKLHSPTISRKHGTFRNVDGIWYYVDNNGKNGTVLNNKRIASSARRKKITEISHGDVFVFGGGEETIINKDTVWGMFTTHNYGNYEVVETKDFNGISFTDGIKTIKKDVPVKGDVVELSKGIAIYMGDITYISGDVSVEQL